MMNQNLTKEKEKSIIEDIINDLENAIDSAIQIGKINISDNLQDIIDNLMEIKDE